MTVGNEGKREIAPEIGGGGASREPEIATQPESDFRELLDVVRSLVAVLRLDGTIIYANSFGQELAGYGEDEILLQNYFDQLVFGQDRAKVHRCFCRACEGESVVDIEHQLLTKRGHIRWVVCSFELLKAYHGKPAVLVTAQDITIHKHMEAMLQQRTHDLGERIKELNCLFGLSKLVEDFGIDQEGILEGLVDILPPSWQYPEKTCARIMFHGQEFKTYNFEETVWKQAAPIMVYGECVGTIEVYYLEEKPESHEGPFLAEERRLIDALAEQLGRIAERIRAEKELRRERDFAESMIETAPAIVLVLDVEGRIVRINPYLEEISGYRLEDVQGKDWFGMFLPERNRTKMRRLFMGAVDSTQRRGHVDTIVVKDGREREIEWYYKRLEDAGGNLIGLLAIGQDITDRRKLEREISEISAREQERIGQELHDGLGQELTGLGYLAETLFFDLQERGIAEAETANNLADGIEHALEQARVIAKGLVLMEIEAGGLLSALRQMVSNTQRRFGIACEFHCNGPALINDTATATQLFRIVQEAVNNSAKHARAKRISVTLRTDDHQTTFTVADDGSGIRKISDDSHGMGLRIMRHRAGVIGAVLDIQSTDGDGTTVVCSLPRSDVDEHDETDE